MEEVMAIWQKRLQALVAFQSEQKSSQAVSPSEASQEWYSGHFTLIWILIQAVT